MKKKTSKQPKRSKPAGHLKDIKPKKDARGGGGITKLGSKRLTLQGDGTYSG